MAVISIDPGLITGIAVVEQDAKGSLSIVYSAELEMLPLGEVFLLLVKKYGPDPDVVIERFTITSATVRNSPAPWSLKVIGMIEWLVWREYGCSPDDIIIEQGPAEVKKLITNNILKKYGLWHKGGKGHANDAIRHGVYRFARLGWRVPWQDTI